MTMKKTGILCLMIFLMLFLSNGTSFAQRHGGVFDKGRTLFMQQLSPEQRTLLQEKIASLVADGASRQEIREAVHGMLQDWGIELPEHHPFPPQLLEQLSEEQRQTLEATVQELKDAGASRQEIQRAVRALLKEWGITPRARRGCDDPPGGKKGTGKLNRQSQTGEALPVIQNVNNYPNPFNPETTISYELTSPETVACSIYNVNGQLVKSLVNGYQSAGKHHITWNGTNADGQPVPSGIYIYRLQAGESVQTLQMILTK